MKINQFENAYGIYKLNLSEYENKLENIVIYASNGVFKTSFANAIEKMKNGKGNEVKDRISDEKFYCEIEYDGLNYTKEDTFDNVIVYSPQIYENKSLLEGGYIDKLLVSKEQGESLYKIQASVNKIEIKVLTFFNKDLGLKDIKDLEAIMPMIDKEYSKVLDALITLYEYLIEMKEKLTLDLSFIDKKKIKQASYKNVLDKEFQVLARDYTSLVNQTFKEILLFDTDFNISNVDGFLEKLKETKFLNENRQIIIGKERFDQFVDFEKYVNAVKRKVYTDEKVIKSFEKLEKKLSTTSASKEIKSIVRKGDPEQIEILSLGRDKIAMMMYGQSLGFEEIEKDLKNLKELKTKTMSILEEVQKEETSFREALKIYRERFNPPFELIIDNKEGSFLGIETPKLSFKYKYPKNSPSPKYSESRIKTMLSSGERTTLDILRFIVEYESKKDSKPVIVIDDIIETFDYANRSGMLAYLDDIKNQDSNLVILTHNFDFFRLVSSRIGGMNKAIATKDENNVVNISKFDGPIFLKDFVKNAENSYDAIALIPLAREITVLKNDPKSHKYRKFFNNLLHIKKEGKDIFMHEVIEKVAQALTKNEMKMKSVFNTQELESSYYQYMLEKHCKERPQGDLLSYKMFLAIQSRLLLEDLLINGDDKMLENISKNQTRELINERNRQNVLSDTALSLCRRVQLYSPEFIHFNAFMYEPLIDVCPKQLEKLVQDLFEIQPDEFYL